MHRRPVQSSNLSSIGYDPASRLLEIEFHSGKAYQYPNVPAHVYQALMAAPSKGKFFSQFIKPYYVGKLMP